MDRPQPTYQVDGAAIRKRRMELGMTLRDCARAAGMAHSYLSEIETGLKEDMRPPKYAGLRTALQIQADDRTLLTPPEEQHRKEPDGCHEGTPRPHPDTG
ncbi:helix-turn-helix domain-containing protein [Streptomyces caniscabiei]|uniref:helix-turn-helix domain-containing protein n=1 Tax=Streptomyces caniscabiei TaxID=2746961 RepID=UPI0029A013CF|nr:helix-turn-helix domain-containing protein [Streptomyces caniscabiei]MDX3515659.1 helix-turn-helix domain-containing protein [Streptomyces caniscabiei]MDX3724878.1 helix-turn-helix domain-containing protein [Streptomyces caniscabiei]